MILALNVLEISAPVFVLALIGFLWVRKGHDYDVEFVTRLAMNLAVPSLIFTALMQAQIDPGALGQIFLATMASYGAVTVLAAVGLRLAGQKLRELLPPMIFGNTGNLGLPLMLFAFGQAGLSYGIVVFAVMAIWNFTFGIWVLSGGGGITRLAREPIVWASLLGTLFLSQGWHTPQVITNILSLIGQIAIPIMLITLGVAVARLQIRDLGRAGLLCVIRFMVLTAVAWAVGRAFDLPPVAFAVLVVQFATPVAVSSYLLAEKYRAGPDTVAGLVVISTIMSILTLPLLLALFV